MVLLLCSTKPTELLVGSELAENLQLHPHPPSPFIIVTQPEHGYSFYHLTEGGRLSQRY